MSVFGSFARAEAGPDSDIDLLIVTSTRGDPDQWALQVQSLADRVAGWTGNRVEHVVLTLNRLADVVAAEEPIVTSWLADSLAVLGPPLTELVATLRDRSVRTADR